VYRLALSILDNPDEAEDGTQETFLAVLRALDSFHGDSSFKTWLFSITINVCRSRLRRENNRERLQQLLQNLFHLRSECEHPERTAMENEADAELWRSICTLDDKHRIPVVLRYYHDLPVADIAAILDIPTGTVHSRLNHARKKLRILLKEK
jgi:RNA polymerase sigma-70 factor (ECF subfamily)